MHGESNVSDDVQECDQEESTVALQFPAVTQQKSTCGPNT